GHGSHITKEMCQLAIKNNIELFCLPPHMTHKLQPLDVGIFGPLQHAWWKQCDKVLEATGEEITREDFIKQYMTAHTKAFTSKIILKAWKNSSIHPLNPHLFNDQDFAPSM
ncbi:hypothetical protein M404DRAFT_128111, partial [Pisolithus tinctorius Marx 270]